MKRLLIMLTTLLFVVALTGCLRADLTVFIPNEFFNPNVIRAFEDEHGVRVRMNTFDSNERMLEMVHGGSHFDIIVPSDYAIEELAFYDFIIPLDWSRIDFSTDLLSEQLYSYIEAFRTQTVAGRTFDILEYGAPYSWGTVGIIYNNTNPAILAQMQQLEADGRSAFEIFNSSLRTVIYDSSRCSMMAAMLAAFPGQHLYNATQAQVIAAGEWLAQAARTPNTRVLSDQIFDEAADITPNFDAIIAYSGCASIIIRWNPNYSFFNPANTNVWIDAMVITNDERTNVDLAYKFVNHMLSFDGALGFFEDEALLYTSMREDVNNIMLDDWRQDTPLYNRISVSFMPQTVNPQFFRFDNNMRNWVATAWAHVVNI